MKFRTQKEYTRIRNRKHLKVSDFIQLIAPVSYKRTQKIRYNKFLKKTIRQYQSLNHGKHPDLNVIPAGMYCSHGEVVKTIYDHNHPDHLDTIHTDMTYKTIKVCPYHYTIDIPMSENPVGWVAECQKIDDKTVYIGGCKFLNKTDNDLNGFGLLWDGCKECGVNDE